MKKCLSAMNITRFLFLLVAIAATVSMVINTGSVKIFLQFFSISSNMLITFCMLYLFIFLPQFKDANKKKLVTSMLFGIFVYLLLGNGLPFLYWLKEVGTQEAIAKTGMTPIRFIIENLLQIVVIPFLLYIMLRYEAKNVFKEHTGAKHMALHFLIVGTTFLGVIYLVIAAMR